jgi:hypothetical protein
METVRPEKILANSRYSPRTIWTKPKTSEQGRPEPGSKWLLNTSQALPADGGGKRTDKQFEMFESGSEIWSLEGNDISLYLTSLWLNRQSGWPLTRVRFSVAVMRISSVTSRTDWGTIGLYYGVWEFCPAGKDGLNFIFSHRTRCGKSSSTRGTNCNPEQIRRLKQFQNKRKFSWVYSSPSWWRQQAHLKRR